MLLIFKALVILFHSRVERTNIKFGSILIHIWMNHFSMESLNLFTLWIIKLVNQLRWIKFEASTMFIFGFNRGSLGMCLRKSCRFGAAFLIINRVLISQYIITNLRGYLNRLWLRLLLLLVSSKNFSKKRGISQHESLKIHYRWNVLFHFWYNYNLILRSHVGR